MEEIQVNDKPKKGGSTTMLVVIIVLLLISNMVTAYFLLMSKEEVETVQEERATVEQEETMTDPVVEESEEMEIPELQTALVGEVVDLGDYTVTLTQVDEDVEEGTVSIDVGEGYKYVSIEILLENKTDSNVSYSTEWTLYDGDGYDYSIYSRREPRFSQNGNISVNGTAKGWLNFRTVENATDFTVKLNETYLEKSIEFVID